MGSESAPNDRLEAQIERYVADYLPTDLDPWFARFRKDKIIHDALWGTFGLRQHEVAILDTPLIQRLRFIHQTGAVYLTYPSAQHTRFEHTLGVLCQTGRLCDALRAQPNEGRIDEALQRDVRVAALLHDTGHGPFSHTSEQFFSGMPQIAEWRTRNPDFEFSGAGEILSYLIVSSKPFRDFADRLNTHFQIDLNCDRIGAIITGTIGANKMYMSEIVHGPFDADKLDYMPRDGMFSGLKMHVDIDRLYHSIKIKSATFKGQQQTRIAGVLSGLTPLTQIMFNKMLLYTGMYHHHKVRAVDCMLWAIFFLAEKNGTKIGDTQLTGPSAFLRLTDDRVLIPELTNDPEIKEIISNIRQRRLWSKALVIARNTVPPTMHEQAPGSSARPLFQGVAQLAGDSPEQIRRRREIADQIWDKAGQPCKRHEVWLDCPKRPGITEAKEMWIDSPGDSQPRILNDFVPVQEWVELYGMHQSRSHVFCPAEATPRIADAAKHVFQERFGLEFLPQATTF